MRYLDTVKLDGEKFRRLTGVKRETFEKMIEILSEAHAKKKAKGGRVNKLSIEDMLVMTLEYLREYRTYFHIGNSYGISESYAYKIIRWVEDSLIKSREFSLPGKRALCDEGAQIEVVLIDATETPIQRPKKNKSTTTLEKRRDIL